jgi:RNA polymerase sigma-70 factor (ECF subfamily)
MAVHGVKQLIEAENVVQESDLDIIAQVLLGNRNAFAELVDKYQTRVRGFCLHMLSDRALAEEASQEVFFKAYNSLDRFRQDAAFSTWLYRITKNHCLDVLRSRKRAAEESWDQLVENRGETLSEQSAAPTHVGATTESRDLVQKALASINPDYREILILREVQGLSYAEISEALDSSLDSVKAKLKRARKEFQAIVRHFSDPNQVETPRGMA